MGPLPQKFSSQNIKIRGRFRTTSELHHECLWNDTTHCQTENALQIVISPVHAVSYPTHEPVIQATQDQDRD